MSDVKRYCIEQIPADDLMHTGHEWALIDSESVPVEGDRGGLVLGDLYEYEHAVLVCDALNNYDALRQRLAQAQARVRELEVEIERSERNARDTY